MSRSANQWGKDFEERPARTVWKVAAIAVALVVALTILASLLSTGTVFFEAGKAKVTNKARETILVFDPNRTLATYEAFYRTCNEYNAAVIQAADAQAEARARQQDYDAQVK